MSKILTALASVQARVKVPKARSAAGRYAYRNLDDICEKLKEPLRESGAVIILSDEPVAVGDRFYIKATATIKAEDGEISAVGYAMEEGASSRQSLPQLTGAASSYARKYALAGLLLLDDARDPDEEEEERGRMQQARPAFKAAPSAAAPAAKAPAPKEGALLAKDSSGQARIKLPSGQWAELGSLARPMIKALIERPEYAQHRAALEATLGEKA